MSILSVFGMMGLVLLGIVLLCIAVTRMEKTAKSSEYDERQQLVRGRGHRLSNFVSAIYMLAIMIVMVGQVDGEKTVEPWLLVFGGFLIDTLVFHVYCLINHAALPLSSKARSVIPGYSVVGVIWLLTYRNTQRWGGPSLVGYGTTGVMDLMLSFYWFALSALHLIAQFRREKE